MMGKEEVEKRGGGGGGGAKVGRRIGKKRVREKGVRD